MPPVRNIFETNVYPGPLSPDKYYHYNNTLAQHDRQVIEVDQRVTKAGVLTCSGQHTSARGRFVQRTCVEQGVWGVVHPRLHVQDGTGLKNF